MRPYGAGHADPGSCGFLVLIGTKSGPISDHAQHELAEIVSVDSPQLGQHAAVSEPCGSVESVKAVSDVQSPASGEIAAVNDQLASAPDLINQDPYRKDWVARLRPADRAWEAHALSAPEYERLLQTESG